MVEIPPTNTGDTTALVDLLRAHDVEIFAGPIEEYGGNCARSRGPPSRARCLQCVFRRAAPPHPSPSARPPRPPRPAWPAVAAAGLQLFRFAIRYILPIGFGLWIAVLIRNMLFGSPPVRC